MKEERTYCAERTTGGSSEERTYGTLKELNVKPGDVIEVQISMQRYVVSDWMLEEWADEEFKVISRASSGEGEESDERSEDETTPKTWGEMPDAEKGELLLAEYRGKIVEVWVEDDTYEGWLRKSWNFQECCRYRIKPEKPPAEPPVEPKRETVTLYGGGKPYMVWCMERRSADLDTHKITFETVDGVPVLDSIKMEEV